MPTTSRHNVTELYMDDIQTLITAVNELRDFPDDKKQYVRNKLDILQDERLASVRLYVVAEK